jgi:hypothetical protein
MRTSRPPRHAPGRASSKRLSEVLPLLAALHEGGGFRRAGPDVLDEKPVPEAGPGEALVRITTTTICGTDIDT